MKATVQKCGCTCGCTESERTTIISETIDGLKNGIAYEFANHRIRHKNPYAKVFIEKDDSDFNEVDTIIPIADSISKLMDEIYEKNYELKRKFAPIYKTDDPDKYPLPKECCEVNNKALAEWKLKLEAIEAERNALELEYSVDDSE